MAKKSATNSGVPTFACPICGRSFESENPPICTGVGTVEERDGTGKLLVTDVYNEDGSVLIASVKHYKTEHPAAVMERT